MICSPYLPEVNQGVYSSEEGTVKPAPSLGYELRHSVYGKSV